MYAKIQIAVSDDDGVLELASNVSQVLFFTGADPVEIDKILEEFDEFVNGIYYTTVLSRLYNKVTFFTC